MESIDRDILICRKAHPVGGHPPVSFGCLLIAHYDSFLPLRRDILYFLSVSS